MAKTGLPFLDAPGDVKRFKVEWTENGKVKFKLFVNGGAAREFAKTKPGAKLWQV